MGRAVPSDGYDPSEPCVPLSRVEWPEDDPLIAPGWRSTTVLALAEGIRADGAFDRLPVLADALEDAGCDNQYILNHCRFSPTHDRNCWVVSAVLRRPPTTARPMDGPGLPLQLLPPPLQE